MCIRDRTITDSILSVLFLSFADRAHKGQILSNSEMASTLIIKSVKLGALLKSVIIKNSNQPIVAENASMSNNSKN